MLFVVDSAITRLIYKIDWRNAGWRFQSKAAAVNVALFLSAGARVLARLQQVQQWQ